MNAKHFTISRRGMNISCKLYFADNKPITRLVLFGHGFGGHKDNRAAEHFAQRALDKLGMATLTFNWPCHGDDVRKKLRLADCDGYLAALTEEAKERFGGPTLYGYATSFGGFLFLKYMADHGSPFEKLALRCPAVDMYGVLTEHILAPGDLEKLEKGKEVPVGFDRKVTLDRTYIQELKAVDLLHHDFTTYMDDVLILHGTRDEIVPMATVQAFADEQLMEFIPVENGDHRFQDPRAMDQAIKEILAFFGAK